MYPGYCVLLRYVLTRKKRQVVWHGGVKSLEEWQDDYSTLSHNGKLSSQMTQRRRWECLIEELLSWILKSAIREAQSGRGKCTPRWLEESSKYMPRQGRESDASTVWVHSSETEGSVKFHESSQSLPVVHENNFEKFLDVVFEARSLLLQPDNCGLCLSICLCWNQFGNACQDLVGMVEQTADILIECSVALVDLAELQRLILISDGVNWGHFQVEPWEYAELFIPQPSSRIEVKSGIYVA